MQTQHIKNKHIDKSFIGVENMFKVSDTQVLKKGAYIPKVAQNSFENTSSFSVSGVSYITNKAGGQQYFIADANEGGAYEGYSFGWFNSISGLIGPQLAFHFSGTVSGDKVTYAFPAGMYGKLFHWCITYNGTTKLASICLNGSLVASKVLSISGTSINTNSIVLGNSSFSNANDCVIGGISNIVQFNKTLTTTEVFNLYKEPAIVPTSLHPYVVGHWTCNQKYGRTLYDSVEQYNYAKGKSVGLQNPEFTDNINGWTLFQFGGMGSATYDTTVYANGGVKIDYGGGIDVSISTPITVEAGKTYTISAGFTKTNATDRAAMFVGSNASIQTGGTVYATLTDTTNLSGTMSTTFTSTVSGTVYVNLKGNVNTANTVIYFDFARVVPTYPQLTANHGELINYTDVEAGVTYEGGASAWNNYYWKKPLGNLARGFFDSASGDRVTTSIDHSSLVNSDITVEFWAKKDNGSSGLAFALGQYGINNKTLHVKFESSIVTFRFWGNTVTFNCDYTTGWNHFEFVYKHATMSREVRMNGVSLGVNTAGPALDLGTGNSLNIGGWTNVTGERFQGYIRNFRIWKGARTAEEGNRDRYKLLGTAPNLFLELPLDEVENGTVDELVATKTGTRAGTIGTVVEFIPKGKLPEINAALKVMMSHYGSYSPVPTGLQSMATSNFSVVADFYIGTDNTAVIVLFSAANTSVWNELQLRITGMNLTYLANQGGLGNVPSGGYTLTAGWHQAAFIKNNGRLELWLNSRLLYYRTDNYSYAGLNSMYIGNGGTGTINAHIANVRMYNRGLGKIELLRLYNNSLFKPLENNNGLLASINFNKFLTIGATKYFEDGSENGYHMSLVGYTTAETTVGDPAYVIKTLHNLRLGI